MLANCSWALTCTGVCDVHSVILLEKNEFLPPVSSQLERASWLQVGFEPTFSMLGFWLVLINVGFMHAAIVSEFICSPVVLYLENTISLDLSTIIIFPLPLCIHPLTSFEKL